MRAVAYVRVSTEEQANEGVSLDAQEARIRAYCSMRGLELAEVIVDAGISAAKPLSKRPGGACVLDLVRTKRVRAVIALKLDRLFRNARDCLAVTDGWERAGVALHLVDMGGQALDTSSAMGKFFLLMLAGVAEMERNLIAERTKTALRHKKANGEKTGGPPPIGYDRADGDVVRLATRDDEQRAIARILELRAAGVSTRRIAVMLDQEGVPARGQRWHRTTVERVLARTGDPGGVGHHWHRVSARYSETACDTVAALSV